MHGFYKQSDEFVQLRVVEEVFLVVNGFKKWQISLDFEGEWGCFFVVYGV